MLKTSNKSWKKRLAAAALSLSLLAPCAAEAQYADVPSDYPYAMSIDLLGQLGVLSGDEQGNFYPEDTLTRAEAAAMVFRMRTGQSTAAGYAGETGFSDVPAEHWAAGYINYCRESGIVGGYPDGTFRPDADVTDAKFVTMLVCALNLQRVEIQTVKNEQTGAMESQRKTTTVYPVGFMVIAVDQTIDAGVTLEPNAPIQRGEAAHMLGRALFSAHYKNDPTDDDYVKNGETYQTMAEGIWHLQRTTGVVQAYENYGTGGLEQDCFSIQTDDGLKQFIYEDFQPEYLGLRVGVWEKATSAGREVVAVAPV